MAKTLPKDRIVSRRAWVDARLHLVVIPSREDGEGPRKSATITQAAAGLDAPRMRNHLIQSSVPQIAIEGFLAPLGMT